MVVVVSSFIDFSKQASIVMPHAFSRSLSVGLDLWEGLLDELSKDCGRKEGHIAFLLAHLQVLLEQTALAQRAVLVAAQVEVLFEPNKIFKKKQ